MEGTTMAVAGRFGGTERTTPVADARPATQPSDRIVARFTGLYLDHYARVVAYAERRLGDRAAAEDCAAEVFRIAWQKTADGQGFAEDDSRPGVPAPGWLFAAARHVVLHHRRALARSLALSERLVQARRIGHGDPLADQDERLIAALERLPDDQRELLLAYYWDGLNGTECGVLFGCSAGAVRVRLHRARAALRRLYSQEES